MGLFDRDKKDDRKEGKKKPDFSNVKSGSSAAAKPEATKEAKTYTVMGGDSLWKISERMYGNGNEWRKIYEANKDRIKDPDVIQPGWVLNIPAHAGKEGEVK